MSPYPRMIIEVPTGCDELRAFFDDDSRSIVRVTDMMWHNREPGNDAALFKIWRAQRRRRIHDVARIAADAFADRLEADEP